MTESGIITDVKLKHPSKALSPIVVTVYSVPLTSSVTVVGMVISPDKSVPDVVTVA